MFNRFFVLLKTNDAPMIIKAIGEVIFEISLTNFTIILGSSIFKI